MWMHFSDKTGLKIYLDNEMDAFKKLLTETIIKHLYCNEYTEFYDCNHEICVKLKNVIACTYKANDVDEITANPNDNILLSFSSMKKLKNLMLKLLRGKYKYENKDPVRDEVGEKMLQCFLMYKIIDSLILLRNLNSHSEDALECKDIHKEISRLCQLYLDLEEKG